MKPPNAYVPLDDPRLDTGGTGDKAGGMAKPNSNVVALSRNRGPISKKSVRDFARVCKDIGLELRSDDDSADP